MSAPPQICKNQPQFHDICPDRARFCGKCGRVNPKNQEGDAKSKAAHGHYLRQSEPDFCYSENQAQESQPNKPKCGCPLGNHGPQHKGHRNPSERGCSGPGRDDSIPIKGEKDTKELKRKLQECISKFDEGSPETINKLEILRNFLNTRIMDEECFPKAEWPHCPVKAGPEPYQLPHPYLPRMMMWAKPQSEVHVLRVSLDGRLADPYRPKTFYYEEPPLNVPPWVLPRYKSQELRAGKLYSGCRCWLKNGLQDDCPRWDCAGRPECREKPLPICPPAMNCPICGVRKPNLYLGKPPTCVRQKPPLPYPEPDISSLGFIPAPKAPSIPSSLHEHIS